MRAPRARLRLAPETYFGGRRGHEAIVESRIAHIVSKRPMLLDRDGRSNKPAAQRAAESAARAARYR